MASAGATRSSSADYYIGIDAHAGVVLCFDPSAFYQQDFGTSQTSALVI